MPLWSVGNLHCCPASAHCCEQVATIFLYFLLLILPLLSMLFRFAFVANLLLVLLNYFHIGGQMPTWLLDYSDSVLFYIMIPPNFFEILSISVNISIVLSISANNILGLSFFSLFFSLFLSSSCFSPSFLSHNVQ